MSDPLFLLLLLPLAWLVWRERRLVAPGVGVPQAPGGLPRSWRVRCAGVPSGLRVMGLALVVLALARPASERHEAWRTPAQGVEIMLVIDCSGSMQARDYTLEGRTASRLEAVQAVVRDFIEKRTEDALGLVLFGETAALQCPLTDDHAILRLSLIHISQGIVR